MIRKYLLPVLAILGITFAVYMVQKGDRPPRVALPVTPPSQSPFPQFVAGAGLIEPASEAIAVGTPVSGIVTRIEVKVGDRVKTGQPLFSLDDRSLRGQLAVQQAALEVARQQLARLQAMPRQEQIPSARAKVQQQLAIHADQQSQLLRLESLNDPRAVSQDDLAKRRFAVQLAKAQLDQAQADLDLLLAGSWKPELDVARAQVLSAQAAVDQTGIELDRLTVRSPMDAQVLQIKIRLGEFAPAGVTAAPLMTIGDTRRFHVRVDIDENDAWRIESATAAVAFARGNRDIQTPIAFVRFEPYVVPKKSLTGESTERVDTRVLQVIYAFDPSGLPLYVGQQMDVFIQSRAAAASASFSSPTSQSSH